MSHTHSLGFKQWLPSLLSVQSKKDHVSFKFWFFFLPSVGRREGKVSHFVPILLLHRWPRFLFPNVADFFRFLSRNRSKSALTTNFSLCSLCVAPAPNEMDHKYFLTLKFQLRKRFFLKQSKSLNGEKILVMWAQSRHISKFSQLGFHRHWSLFLLFLRLHRKPPNFLSSNSIQILLSFKCQQYLWQRDLSRLRIDPRL